MTTFFFWPTKFSFSPRAPLNLYSPQPNLFLLGYLALSDCLTPREFKQWVDSLSLEFLFYSTQVLIRRARSTRLMLQLTDDQYRRPPTPRCTNISSLFMYVGPLSLAPIVFSYPSTDWLCAPFRRNRCPSFTPFQRPLLSLFDLVDSFC